MNKTELERQVGVGGAVMMGLGSIVGTGVFVSIGIGYSIAQAWVLPAILVATIVATLNGLSSAQLAANHPVSGGTYAYGNKWLTPWMGFSAGTMFLVAKSASAATAALACSSIILRFADQESLIIRTGLAVGIVLIMTILVFSGLKRSNTANIVIVSITLLSLLAIIGVGLGFGVVKGEIRNIEWFNAEAGISVFQFLECCALMFVAFTGYGRIATLGEEIRDPRANIPRAIILTLVISGLLYASIGLVFVVGGNVGDGFGQLDSGQFPELSDLAKVFEVPVVGWIVSIGALTAMLGVLLNLILGLSRVYFAMGREGDLPRILGKVNDQGSSPGNAVLLTGIVIAGLTLIGDVKMTWSFSAFTVLIYYAVTNLAATRLTAEERYFPSILAWLGFLMCLSLAFFVSPTLMGIGLGILVVANLGRMIFRR